MYVILIKLPKVNSHPLGENSPNLVTCKSEKAHFIFTWILGSLKAPSPILV
jgi:hypothetical protein